MNRILFLLLIVPGLLAGQGQGKFKSKYTVDDLDKTPAAPDYSQLKYWIAHPDQEDAADLVPGKGELMEYQETADVDVFFVYPTIYTKKQHPDHPWIADVDDEKLNKKIAESTIKNQATVFNSSARVYSPLYRQAHIGIYFLDLELKLNALKFAYQDVRQAFMYYMENYNKGRPIIIASHSQGTTHAESLLKEFFEGKKLMNQLVAAYLVGMPLRDDTFKSIPICEDESETGCWLSWNTYKQGYYPPNHDFWYDAGVSVNPLSWKRDSTYTSWGANLGGVLKNYKKIRPGLSDAQNKDGMLWVNKPRFFGRIFINWDRYHIVDYNLFYRNIRENVENRVEAYLED
ncbi:MAG: DUF3089 domain-containing protein [Cyclobacteriaceae bacterium]